MSAADEIKDDSNPATILSLNPWMSLAFLTLQEIVTDENLANQVGTTDVFVIRVTFRPRPEKAAETLTSKIRARGELKGIFSIIPQPCTLRDPGSSVDVIIKCLDVGRLKKFPNSFFQIVSTVKEEGHQDEAEYMDYFRVVHDEVTGIQGQYFLLNDETAESKTPEPSFWLSRALESCKASMTIVFLLFASYIFSFHVLGVHHLHGLFNSGLTLVWKTLSSGMADPGEEKMNPGSEFSLFSCLVVSLCFNLMQFLLIVFFLFPRRN